MNFRFVSMLCTAITGLNILVGTVGATEVVIGDSYARGGDNGLVWTIGTKSIEMTFDGHDGVFRLVSFLNKSCESPLQYVNEKTAAAPFVLDAESFIKGAAEDASQWMLKTGDVRQVATGGRPAVQLDIMLTRGDILAQFHVLTFPGTSILRQWVEIENTGSLPVGLNSPAAARFQLRSDEATSLRASGHPLRRLILVHRHQSRASLFARLRKSVVANY